MVYTKVQLSGGGFQDASGNPLANGFLLLVLSQDARVNDSQVASGRELTINLDSSGNVDTTTPQYVWPNDVLSPENTFYMVSGYTAQGQLVWGPNAQQVFSTPQPFGVQEWLPQNVNTNNAPVVTYDVGYYHPYTSPDGEVTLRLPLERAVRFAFDLAPSRASCGTNATATSVYSVQKNGVEFATITFTAGSSSGVIASSVGVTFAAGDILTIVAPSPSDSTLASVGILLSGVALN